MANAQHDLGVATSGYSAINSLYLNPANISGCNEKLVVSLFSLNTFVDNNLGTFSKISELGNNNPFNVSGNAPFSMLAPVIDLHLPAILISLNDKLKQSFALTTRVRAMNQFNHFDPTLYQTATSSDHTASQDYTYQSANFNWTAHVWSEVGLSYALQLMDNGPHNIKAGVTLKYLGGIDYLAVKGKNLDVKYTAGNDTFYAKNSDLEFASNAISSNSAVSNGVQSSDVLGSLFGSKAGSGFGMDIGVTYTYNIGGDNKSGDNDNTGNDGHKLKVSAAVTDIGAIKYKEGNNYFINVTGNGYLTGSGLSQHTGNFSDFSSYAKSQGFTADTGSKATKVYMPTALITGIDYQASRLIYVNATYIANLANRQNFGNSYYSQVSLTPRLDYKLITVGLPITYSALASDVKVGLGFRVSGFFFGSDDMLALLSSNQHGFGVYFGGYIPLYKKKHKDSFK